MKNTFLLALCFSVVLTGCHSVTNVQRVSSGDVNREGTIVFVRSPHYSLFGTKSFRDYVEVTHERTSRNNADFLQVEIGFRNRGGQHFWDLHGPDFSLSVKTAFYDQPFNASYGQTSVPVYETNWQPLSFPRGATVEYKAVCPKKSAGYYQVTLSEILK